MSDPYLDPQSGILLNKFGLADQESLDRAESNSVSVRSILLQLNPLKGDFDSEHLKAIHSYLFRDVYEWAGQFRTIPLAKAEDVRGGLRVAPSAARTASSCLREEPLASSKFRHVGTGHEQYESDGGQEQPEITLQLFIEPVILERLHADGPELFGCIDAAGSRQPADR